MLRRRADENRPRNRERAAEIMMAKRHLSGALRSHRPKAPDERVTRSAELQPAGREMSHGMFSFLWQICFIPASLPPPLSTVCVSLMDAAVFIAPSTDPPAVGVGSKGRSMCPSHEAPIKGPHWQLY